MGGGEHLTSKLEKYIGEAIENIRKDREVTNELLTDLIQFIAKNEQNHKDVGLTAAKYVETLQRSNEQLVKISAIMQKEQKEKSNFDFTSADKNNLYDLIKKEETEE
tara:strand:- start:329 stop:649 length:321 start_codon:yes stop_codon:yes gene_type:complete